jgi:UDP-galactopyranose mutase
VSAVVDGIHVPVPFNLNSLYATFSQSQARQIEEELVRLFGFGATVSVLSLLNANSPVAQNFAQYVYDRVFKRYTQKQWGMSPEEIDPSVTARVPIRVSRDDRYFTDRYQFMPKHGYTALIENLLNHPRIKVLLNADFREVLPSLSFKRMIYTGPVDAFFDFVHGELPYRSLRFDMATLDREFAQPTAAVNFPNDYAFTRQTEMKRLTGQVSPKTVVATEYPLAWLRGRNEPYYPIPNEQSRERHDRYRAEVAKLDGSVLFVGRLAEYKYYNMDEVVSRALEVFDSAIVQGAA